MPEENTKKIEKPWAVIWPYYIGRIEEERTTGNLLIRDSERQQYSPLLWKPTWVRRFNTPIQAIAYCSYLTKKYSSTDLLNLFCIKFPSERANLEKLLPKRFAQSPLKLTQIIDETGWDPVANEQVNAQKVVRRIDAMEPGYSEAGD